MLHKSPSVHTGSWIKVQATTGPAVEVKVLDWADRVLGESVWKSPAPCAVEYQQVQEMGAKRCAIDGDADDVMIAAFRDGQLVCWHVKEMV